MKEQSGSNVKRGAHHIKSRGKNKVPELSTWGELNTPYGDGSTVAEIEYLHQAAKDPKIVPSYAYFKYAWKVIKGRTKQLFGTLEAGFRHYSVTRDVRDYAKSTAIMHDEQENPDPFINYEQFSKFLKDLGISLNHKSEMQLWDRGVKMVAECAIEDGRESDHQRSFAKKKGVQGRLRWNGFQFLLLNGILEKMNERLKVCLMNVLRKRRRVQAVVALLLAASKENKKKALARFHEKLTYTFVDDLRHNLTRRVQEDPTSIVADKSPVDSNVSRWHVVYGHVIHRFACEIKFFWLHEKAFLKKFIDGISKGRGMVSMPSVLVALSLVAYESTTEQKLRVMFRMFDTDNDDCLNHEQVLELFAAISEQLPLVEQNYSELALDQIFLGEMSMQRARRVYETLLSKLTRKKGKKGTRIEVEPILEFSEFYNIMEPLLNQWMPVCPTVQWVVPPMRGAAAVMDEIHDNRCRIEEAEIRALQHEARDSVRPKRGAVAPSVPRNDGRRLRTEQWSVDLQEEMNTQPVRRFDGGESQRNRRKAKLSSAIRKVKTTNFLESLSPSAKMPLRPVGDLGMTTADYTREAQLRVRNTLRQTKESEMPTNVVKTHKVLDAPPVLKDVHNSTLTNWVKDLHTEFTHTKHTDDIDDEEIEDHHLRARHSHSRKPRAAKGKIRKHYRSEKVLVGLPQAKDVAVHSDFFGTRDFERFQIASTVKAAKEIEEAAGSFRLPGGASTNVDPVEERDPAMIPIIREHRRGPPREPGSDSDST
jgi:hypothetical protein